MAFDAGTVYSELHLNRSPFIRSLTAARAEAADFARRRYQATLDASAQEFIRNLSSVRREGVEFARQRYEASIGANTLPARRALSGFNETWRRYSRSWGQQGIRARVTADLRRTHAQLRNLERALDSVENEEHRVQIEAEVLRARQRLEGLQTLAKSVGAQDPIISVGIRGVAATYASMFGLQRLADRLDGYNVRLSARVDVDRSLSTALPNLLGALELQVARYRTVTMAAAAATMPVFLSAISAIPAAASIAGTTVGSLAITVSKGLAGGLGAATVALGLGSVALFAYGTTVQRTIGFVTGLSASFNSAKTQLGYAEDALKAAKKEFEGATKGTEAYRKAQIEVAFAQANVANEQARLNALLDVASPNLLKLTRGFGQAQAGAIRLGGAMADAVSPAILHAFGLFGQFESGITAGSVSMVRDMNKVSVSFMDAAASGQNLRSIETILQGIKAAGVPSLRIVGNVALFAVNSLAPMVSTGLDVLRTVRGLTNEANRWAASAEGQRRIADVWADLWSRGKRLLGVALDLGAGLWGIVRALDRSGTGDWLFRQIERGADSFERLMEAGGKGRREIVAFGRDVRPVLSAAISLADEGQRQFWRLVDAVRGGRKEGRKFGTLVDVIKAVEDSLRPLTNLLIHEFETIGPLLPPLVRQLSEWFSVMGRATPEMQSFLKFLTRALGLFNDLPDKQQIFIARTIAIASAVQALGGGVVIGAFAKFIAQWLLLRRIFRNFPKTPPVTGPATTLPPAFGGKQQKPPEIPKTLTARLAPFLGLAGGVGLLLAGIFLYDDYLKPVDDKLTAWLKNKFGLNFKVNLDKKINWGNPVDAGSELGAFLRRALTNGKQKGERHNRTLGWKDIGRQAMVGILNGIPGGGLISMTVKRISEWYQRAKRESGSKGWKGIGSGAAGSVLKGFLAGGLIGGAIALIGSWFTKSKNKRDSQKWKPLGSSAAGAIAQGFKNGGLIGGAVALIASWFAKSQGEKNRKRWKPLGSSAAGLIAAGWMNGGLVGAGIRLVASWFTKSQSEKNNKKWKPLGSSAAGLIVTGWMGGGLVAAGVRLIASWFTKSQSEKSRKRWRPIGDSAAGLIVSGWMGGGLVAAGIKLIASWFTKSQGEKNKKRWRPLGESAAGLIASGWKNGGLIGAAAALIASWFTKTKQEKDRKDWHGCGADATGKIKKGANSVSFRGVAANIFSGIVNYLTSGSALQRLYNIGRALVGNVLRGAQDRSREGSPSREMMERGRLLVAGLLVSVGSRYADARHSGAELMRNFLEGAKRVQSLRLDYEAASLSVPRLSQTAGRSHRTGSANVPQTVNYGGSTFNLPPVSINVNADLEAAERKAIETVRQAFAELRRQAGTSTASFGGVV